ncbi:MAG: hypothetical protein ACTS45_00525 [Candidatus Hodgkinia cicadicola]
MFEVFRPELSYNYFRTRNGLKSRERGGGNHWNALSLALSLAFIPEGECEPQQPVLANVRKRRLMHIERDWSVAELDSAKSARIVEMKWELEAKS